MKKFLYISIPKTGGGSIQKTNLVDPSEWANHNLARDIPNLSNFFSFSMIRNPYEKVVSSYFFYKLKSRDYEDLRRRYSPYKTFKDFVLRYDESKKLDRLHYQTTSWDYVSNENGEIIVNYLGKFENINEEFNKVQRMNGIEEDKIKKLPSINISEHEYWKNYYDDYTASIIYDYWKQDFLKFDFKKESYRLDLL